MTINNTTLKKGDNLPPRGPAFRTRVLNALRQDSMLKLNPDSTRDEAEQAYVKEMARRAFNPDEEEQQTSGTVLIAMFNKMYPSLKQVAPEVTVPNFPENGTQSQKANAILKAIADGLIPPDVGSILIGAAKDCIVIEQGTELKQRIEEIEKKLGVNS